MGQAPGPQGHGASTAGHLARCLAALALGIGANAAVFTFVNAVLVRGLPFHEGDRIMAVWTEDERGQQLGTSELDYEDWRRETRSFSDLAASLGSAMNLSDGGRDSRYGGRPKAAHPAAGMR